MPSISYQINAIQPRRPSTIPKRGNILRRSQTKPKTKTNKSSLSMLSDIPPTPAKTDRISFLLSNAM
ncbi:hypothetical protein BDN72DRAFT_842597, partial [Pluteus cervinus]